MPVCAIIMAEDIACSRQTVDMSVTITRSSGCPVSRSVTRPRMIPVPAATTGALSRGGFAAFCCGDAAVAVRQSARVTAESEAGIAMG